MDQVSGPMLLQAYHDMPNKVRIRLADYSKYLTLSCDGWSRTQGKEHLLGFTACDPSSGMVVFLDFVSNADSERCNGQFTLEKTLEIAMKHSIMLSNKETESEVKLSRPWRPDAKGLQAAELLLSQYHVDSSLSRLGLDISDFSNPGKILNGVQWWSENGHDYPELKDVAPRVSCCPATSFAGERVFSALAHIRSDKRASMLMGRAAMLAFVYFNKRVMDRQTSNTITGPPLPSTTFPSFIYKGQIESS
ncbi:hypothetical protein CEUSTIGMA_g7315.t1 [Chlamydomonas eustigma]|uniref:HAT C-terminal dimerisation domain-containing protein n=1 Tax=Chlamydomonas eustigma TaxID=1157962 RepID=A0A250X9V0_9CHLO|nr:hypothetical protein CEUSTIGMA_g7315.t1 [Chlamydomonas eustigma]|eukprot:GAX79875.1 hypothetical protein CEUSTIGMA_g7315.t1 [Chlamydomonas eustigma]